MGRWAPTISTQPRLASAAHVPGKQFCAKDEAERANSALTSSRNESSSETMAGHEYMTGCQGAFFGNELLYHISGTVSESSLLLVRGGT